MLELVGPYMPDEVEVVVRLVDEEDVVELVVDGVVDEAGGVSTKYAATPATTKMTTMMATVAWVLIALRLREIILGCAKSFQFF